MYQTTHLHDDVTREKNYGKGTRECLNNNGDSKVSDSNLHLSM